MSNSPSGIDRLPRQPAGAPPEAGHAAIAESDEAQLAPELSLDEHPVVLFDGVCNLCARSVHFIIKRDPGAIFRFASLQSQAGQELVANCRFQEADLDSIVLAQSDRCYDRSDAALRIARRLRFPWPLFHAFIIVPRPLRDWVYRVIARNRYRWFGRRDQCWLPTEGLKRRFIDMDE